MGLIMMGGYTGKLIILFNRSVIFRFSQERTAFSLEAVSN
jgi:hypothetical protein